MPKKKQENVTMIEKDGMKTEKTVNTQSQKRKKEKTISIWFEVNLLLSVAANSTRR